LVPRQLCKLGKDVRGFGRMPQHRSLTDDGKRRSTTVTVTRGAAPV
jgi:hypothetical protein